MTLQNKYDLVIFDWDGTLMDSIGAIVSCMQAAAEDLNIEVPSERAIRDLIGLSLPKILNILFTDLVHLHEDIVSRYRHHFLSTNTVSPLFAGSERLLNQLFTQGYTLAIATGKGRSGLERVLTLSGTGHYFAASRCADEMKSKPDPMMIDTLLAHFNVPAHRAVMIGDSVHDLHMANNAGVAAIGVSYGANLVEQLQTANPLAIVDNVAELVHHL
ncbi:HAD-IA family hydrolase [Shewanella sp. OMA3-2]|uniref:HAD-IA family hydrolase n=1 Tax=Shewanella sp. OMA3-2 TaxID=2908650 RepID=UPI001F46F883|nr:HAD-IA family hydrolase [Shewanella sp. OMA3-2]UJF21051.1 HAD-IA family hydrolase [Shewanella sp. OMA3-2]